MIATDLKGKTVDLAQELTINEYLRKTPQGKSCSRCGKITKTPAKKLKATVCADCTQFLSQQYAHIREARKEAGKL